MRKLESETGGYRDVDVGLCCRLNRMREIVEVGLCCRLNWMRKIEDEEKERKRVGNGAKGGVVGKT